MHITRAPPDTLAEQSEKRESVREKENGSEM